MRYAILGDIHSNLEALQEVIWALKRENIDEYLCIGDIVGYSADPKNCIKIIRQLCSKIIAGNHDWACVGKLHLDWFRDIAKDALAWTIPLLDNEEKSFLFNLELIYETSNFTPLEKATDKIGSKDRNADNDLMPSSAHTIRENSLTGFTLVHGTLFEPEEFHYLTNLDYAYRNFQVLKTQICFLGHTHKPIIFMVNEKGEISYSWGGVFILENNLRYIVNVGSVGQPRDGDSRACFCIYDSEKKSIEFKRVEYDFKKTQEKILANNLPEKLAWRLSAGR